MRPSLTVFSLAACLHVLAAGAAPPASAEAQNGGAAIALVAGGVRVPFCVVAEPDSGALVLFEDTRNANIDVYAQRLDRHGKRLLGAGGSLVASMPIGASLQSFTPDGSGGAAIAWTQNNGATGLDIVVQRVLPNGTIAYPASGLVVCNAAGDQTYPYMAPGTGGFYWVAWTDARAGVLGVADVYAQRLSLAGAAQLPANGLLINTLPFRAASYANMTVAPDLLGGLLLTWNVNAPGGVRAQRVGPTGTLLFGATGAALADPTDSYATIVPDGSGGLWAWSGRNSSIYAHHLVNTGTSSFAPSGIAIHDANPNGFDVHAVRDASGGCFFYGISRNSGTSTGSPLFRQQVSSTGTLLRGSNGDNYGYNVDMMSLFDTGTSVITAVDEFPGLPGWQTRVQRWAYDGTPGTIGNGVVVSRQAPNFGSFVLVTGGSGNIAVCALADPRYNTASNPYNFQVFGQAVDAGGNALWDDSENPVLASVKDSPGDQGGSVRATWSPSAADDPAAKAVVGYHGWRSLEPAAAAALAGRHPGVTGAFRDGSAHYLALAGQFWEMVATTPATQLAGYALTLPTGQDSTSSRSGDESFMVEAYDDSSHHWYSNALVAHSVDNLPPAVPAPFTGNYVSGTTYLLWNANHEADLAGYRLYRGGTSGFVPGAGNLVTTLTSPGFDDAAGFPGVYKLSAIDVHGNESGFAVLVPNGAASVDDHVPARFAFALGSGNPSRGAAALRLALPANARVRVAIYDVGGREVRTLADGERAAGTYALVWDGRDASGHAVASGLYFARLVMPDRESSLRLAMQR